MLLGCILPERLGNHSDWEAVLSDMEADLTTAISSISPTGDTPARAAGWSAPTRIGPLPAGLIARARRILADQHAAVRRLEEERELVAQHLAAVRSVPAVRAEKQAVYLDVTG
jgi:hypothetical protein